MSTEDTTTPHGAILPDQASGTYPRIPAQSIQMNSDTLKEMDGKVWGCDFVHVDT